MVTSNHLTSRLAAERQRDLLSSRTFPAGRAGRGSRHASMRARVALAIDAVRARGRVRRVRRPERAGC